MTNKVYRTAMGKPVDIGALLLQNETVRAVGNMSVNARGDVIDSRNKVIDSKNRQIQRQQKRQTNVTKSYQQQESQDTFNDLPEDNDVVVQENTAPTWYSLSVSLAQVSYYPAIMARVQAYVLAGDEYMPLDPNKQM